MKLVKQRQIEGYEEDQKKLRELIENVKKDIEEAKISASRVETKMTKSGGEKYNLENLLEDMYLDNVDISRTVVPIPTVKDIKKVFNKKIQRPTISEYDKDIIDISGDYEATNYGEYTFGFSLKNKANYIWEDNTIGVKKFTWKIDRLSINIPDIYDKVKVYDSFEQSPTIVVYDTDAVIVGGETEATEVGVKTITFKLASENYIWEDETTGIKTATWEILSASLDEPFGDDIGSLVAKTMVYNWKAQTPDFTYNKEEIELIGESSATDIGTYTVYFRLKNPEKYTWKDGTTADKTGTWTILPKTIFVPTVTGTNKVYNDKEQKPYISYNDEYVSMTGTPYATLAGDYEIKFTLLNPNFAWSNKTTAPLTYSWKIMPRPIDIPIVSNTEIIYTGEEIGPNISYDKENVIISGTYKTTESGTYTVTFTLKDSNQIWVDETIKPKSYTWTIDRIVIPSEYSTFSQDGKLEYNKKTQSPTIKGYNSEYCTISGNTEIEPGTYIATITPKNGYKWSDGTIVGRTCIWTINKKQLTIPSLSNTSYTYDGTTKTPGWNNFDELYMKKGGTYSTANGGIHSATVSLLDPDRYIWNDNTTGDKSLSWTISPKAVAIPTLSGKSKTYTGTEQSPTTSTFDSNEIKQSGTASAIKPGTYTVTWTLTNTSNYIWSDKTSTAKSDTWTISVKTVSIPTLSNTSKTYNGSSQNPTISSFSSDEIAQNGTTSAINAGTYTITWTLKDTSNYKWADGTTTQKSSTWTINQKSVTVPTLSNGSKTYTGSVQSPTVSTFSSNEIAQGGTASATNAGTYTVTWILSSSNYKWSDGTTEKKSSTWSIDKKAVTIPTLSNSSKSYTGSSQSPTINNYNSSYMTQSGTTSATTAGTYTITWALSNANYKWSDGTVTNKSASWSINKLSGSLSLSASSVSLDSSNKTKTVTVTRSGTGTITVKSSNTSIAKVSISGTTITITAVATGSCTITVSVAADTNYTAPANKSISVSCQMVPTLNQTGWSQISTYAKAGNADLYYDIGDTKAITLNGKVGNFKTFSNETFYVFILDINHPINGKADNNIIFGGFKKNINGTMKDVALVDSRYQAHQWNICLHTDDGKPLKCFTLNHEFEENMGTQNGKPAPGYYGTNYGGWKGTDFRYDILGATSKAPSMYNQLKTSSNVGYDATSATISSPVADTLMAALPSDFRSQLKLWTRMIDCVGNDSTASSSIKSCVDAITLLNVTEVFSTTQINKNPQNHGLSNGKTGTNLKYYYNTYEKNYNTRMAYYANGNSQYKLRDNGTGSSSATYAYQQIYALWTLCTPYAAESHSANDTGYYFIQVWPSRDTTGDSSANITSASASENCHALAPAFKI